METPRQSVSDWLLGVFAMKTVDHLQYEILQTPSETSDPCEALSKAYEMLTDEQKIAFLLTGGAERLFRYQQHPIQEIRTGRCSSDTETGQLPIVC
jgi:hypothetical protein